MQIIALADSHRVLDRNCSATDGHNIHYYLTISNVLKFAIQMDYT